MAELKEQLRTITQDLMNLQVNTIIKQNMTGMKMPGPRHALLDIAQLYRLKLTDIGLPLDSEDAPGSFESFNKIRARADKGLKIIEKRARSKNYEGQDDAKMMILYRIKRMVDQIKGLFKSLEKRGVEGWENEFPRDAVDEAPPLELVGSEMVLLRKIWEMGLEDVAMQTVIQLDGDVLTRIEEKYVNKESEIIHRLHNQGVTISLRFWKELVGIVQDFFGSMAKSLS